MKSMVYLSSMEVYGFVQGPGAPRNEDSLGEAALSSPRSCYPLGKHMAQHHHVTAVDILSERVAQTTNSTAETTFSSDKMCSQGEIVTFLHHAYR